MPPPITPISDRDASRLNRAYEDAVNNFTYAKGVRIFESYLNEHPRISDEVFLYRLALLYDHVASQKNTERLQYESRAFRLYRRILRINPDSYQAVWGIARIWWHRKNRKAIPFALRAYRMVQHSARKGDTVAQNMLAQYAQNVGLIYDVIGEDKKAELWLLKGLRIQPRDWGMYVNMVAFYGKRGLWMKLKVYAHKLEILYKKESSLKGTVWGNAISGMIEYAKKPISELNKLLKKKEPVH